MFDKPPLTEISAAGFTTTAVLVWALIARRDSRDLLLAWVGAMSLALIALGHAPMGLVFAVGMTAASPFMVTQRTRNVASAAGLVAVVLVLTYELDAQLVVGALITGTLIGPLLWLCNRSFGPVVPVIVMTGSALGIYINVPDTEQIATLAAGLMLLAAAMVVFAPLRTPTAWFESLALIGALVMCTGAIGARGRPESFLGVVGVIGVLAAEPVAALVWRGTQAYPVLLITVHAGVVITVSRIAGRYGDASILTVAAGALAVATVVLIVLPRRRLHREPSDGHTSP